MKKYVFVVLAIMVAVSGCRAMMLAAIEPDDDFDIKRVPPAPDYANARNWAASPTQRDGADVVPAGFKDTQVSSEFDVFFVHPTTYISDDNWNQPLGHEKADDGVDTKVLPNQASVFNGAAKVYAPRYRQATLASFTSATFDNRSQALELAYSDVDRAFTYFLKHQNHNRPFFVASHSQGSQHASRLLHRISENADLRSRLVAAYIIGTAVQEDAASLSFANIKICQTPTQVGCMISYNSIKPGFDPARFYKGYTWLPSTGYTPNTGKKFICVNPITWARDDAKGSTRQHIGAWRQDDGSKEPDPHFASARCANGILEVSPTRDDYEFSIGRYGDLHLVDYSLFYLDIRHNAQVRAHAWLKRER